MQFWAPFYDDAPLKNTNNIEVSHDFLTCDLVSHFINKKKQTK